MLKRYRTISLFILFNLLANNLFAAGLSETSLIDIQKDSIKDNKNLFQKIYHYLEESNKPKEDKKFDFSFIAGPYYSNETKVGLGIIASGLYRLDRENLTLQPSNVSLYTNASTNGYFTLGVEGNNILNNDKYRIIYDLGYIISSSKFWGIGYQAAQNNDKYTNYKENKLNLKIDALQKIREHTYWGLSLSAQDIHAKKFDDISLLNDKNPNNKAIGGGIMLSYDSRDFIPNAYKGLYIKLENIFFLKEFGSSSKFINLIFVSRYFKQISEGTILALDLNANLNYGNIPWEMLALVGGSTQMRGYYKGQYRDKKLIYSQIELRQKLFNRNGIVLWAGVGSNFPNFNTIDLNQVLPTFGAGYRWEFKNRINIRLDFGVGRNKQRGFYLSVNESF